MRAGLLQLVYVIEQTCACGEKERCVSRVVAEMDGGALGQEQTENGKRGGR